MSTVDFKEIPLDNALDGAIEQWNIFAREFISNVVKFEILSGVGQGVDFGKDLIVKGSFNDSNPICWLVSCKHYAHSGKSVGKNDEQSITDRIQAHKCEGFIAFYSTVPSSEVLNRIENIDNSKIYDCGVIENELLSSDIGIEMFQRFFPNSYKKWFSLQQRPIHINYQDIKNQIVPENVPYYLKITPIKNNLLIELSPTTKDAYDTHPIKFSITTEAHVYEEMKKNQMYFISPDNIHDIESSEAFTLLAPSIKQNGIWTIPLKKMLECAVVVENKFGDSKEILLTLECYEEGDVIVFTNNGFNDQIVDIRIEFNTITEILSCKINFTIRGLNTKKALQLLEFKKLTTENSELTICIASGDSTPILTSEGVTYKLLDRNKMRLKLDTQQFQNSLKFDDNLYRCVRNLFFIEKHFDVSFTIPVERDLTFEELENAQRIVSAIQNGKFVYEKQMTLKLLLSNEEFPDMLKNKNKKNIELILYKDKSMVELLNYEISLGRLQIHFFVQNFTVEEIDKLLKRFDSGVDNIEVKFQTIEDFKTVECYLDWGCNPDLINLLPAKLV